jgi:hypothetical protein
MMTIEFVTPLGHKVIAALKALGGEAATRDVAAKAGGEADRPSRVVPPLCELRGLGFVTGPHAGTRWRLISENGREASKWEQDNLKRKVQP